MSVETILIVTWLLAQPSYDGGTAVHSQQVKFASRPACEAAARAMRAEAVKFSTSERPRIWLVAVCAEVAIR